jgi:LDH2 family malate/lactate/ureidoglycolate dehydrogenase
MDLLLSRIVKSKPATNYERVVYAGYLENEEFVKRSKEGIPYHKEVIEWFENYSSELGIECDLR